MIVGEIITKDRTIVANEGKKTATIKVINCGDRPIQVGSHFHFFEVNKLLKFDRAAAYGMHLDIPSGTSVRFEPGETKTVNIVEVGGKKAIYGLSNLTCGAIGEENFKIAMEKATAQGFIAEEMK